MKKMKYNKRVLNIFLVVFMIFVVVLLLSFFIHSRKESDRFKDAVLTLTQGNLEQGLEKCVIIENNKNRGFCYSYYLALRLKLIDDTYAEEYGENITQEQQENKQRQIQKEYAFVCGYDMGNPYMKDMC